MAIELSADEKDLLVCMLEKELDEVRSELHHAQVHDFKDDLRAREALVRVLIEKIGA